MTLQTLAVVFLGFVSFWALKEYFSMIPTRRADRRVLFWAYLTIPFQYFFAATGWYGMFLIFIPVYMFLLIPARMILNGETKHFLHSIGSIHWGLMTTVYCLSYVAYLLCIPNNIGILVFLLALTTVNAFMPQLWGKVLMSMLVSVFLAGIVTPFNLIHAMILSSLISITSLIGDANIAQTKTDMQVDGQAKILSRVNSLTFTAPVYFHYINYFYPW